MVRGATCTHSSGLKFDPACRKQLRKKEEHEWAIEKPKLDNVRRLRGIYIIDPEDGEYKETTKNERKKLEIPMEAGMSCKMEAKKHSKLRETADESDESDKIQKDKSMHVSWKLINNLRESVWNPLYQKIMKITSQVKDTIRKVTAIFSAQIYSDAPSDENSGCERRSGQRVGEARKVVSVAIEQGTVILEAEREKKNVQFASLMDTCHLKNAD